MKSTWSGRIGRLITHVRGSRCKAAVCGKEMLARRLLGSLRQPAIPVNSKNVKILHSPSKFYATLLEMIGRAQRRIYLSSLYIGASESLLIKSLKDSLSSNPRLQVHIHLDLRRSTRPGPTSTASALLPLVSEFPGRCSVYFFQSPTLKAPLSYVVPRRFDEVWGTWHAKSYIVDDDIILSGANLNKSYFTNRQDRYLFFASSPSLSNYIVDFLTLFSRFSYRLYPHETNVTPIFRWPNSNVNMGNLGSAARQCISNFHSTFRNNAPQEADTIVFPVIQAGYMNVREEEDCLQRLFVHLNQLPDASSAVIDLTSGYFALHKLYQDLLINSPVKARVLAASCNANGFLGSKGLSGRVPEGYILLLRRFRERVLRVHGSTSSKVEISEWEKNGWTYHAKGLWYRSHISSPPELTLFGSTNLNSRSAELDTELSFLMSTGSTDLRAQLDEEFHHLSKDARVLQEKDWENSSRQVRIGTQVLIASGLGHFF